MPPPSSSSKRRMENYGPSRITDVSTNTQSAINIPSPSFLIYSLTFGELLYSQNWTFDGGITMYASKKETNTRRPSKHAMGSSNPQLCSLASATPLPPFRQ